MHDRNRCRVRNSGDAARIRAIATRRAPVERVQALQRHNSGSDAVQGIIFGHGSIAHRPTAGNSEAVPGNRHLGYLGGGHRVRRAPPSSIKSPVPPPDADYTTTCQAGKNLFSIGYGFSRRLTGLNRKRGRRQVLSQNIRRRPKIIMRSRSRALSQQSGFLSKGQS